MELEQETKLINLKRKLLEKRSKVEAMLFELQELNKKITELKPDNSEVIKVLKELKLQFEAFELKPEIKVENKEVKVEPNIKVNPPEVLVNFNEAKLIAEIQEMAKKIQPDKTNKLLSELINRISEIELKPKINVESKEVKVEPIFDPKIEVKPSEIKFPKDYTPSAIKTLQNALERLISPFFSKVSGFINKVSEYIKQPDRIVVSDYEISEWYGDKKITYRIKDDGNKMEIINES